MHENVTGTFPDDVLIKLWV